MDSTTPQQAPQTAPSSDAFAGARILFVTTVPVTLTTFLIPFAEHLQARGAHVDCACANASTVEGLDVFEQRYDVGWSRSLLSMTHFRAIRAALFKALDSHHYDIVHVHTPIAAYLTRKALAQWKKKHHTAQPVVIYTAHGLHFYQGQPSRFQHKIFHALEKHALPWTDTLVVMNDEDEQSARALQATHPSTRIQRIDGIGFDFAQFDEVRTARVMPHNTLDERGIHNEHTAQLCIVAEHNDNKNIGMLLDAIALLKKRGVGPFHLTLIGSGPLTDTLKSQANACSIEDLLTFTGQLDRTALDACIAQSDIGILVSKREGLPRSLMEFCAAGACIAGTVTRGIKDEVRDSRALAYERSAECIADMLQDLIENPTMQQSIAREQYEHAKRTYDLPLIIAAYDELYVHYLVG